MKGFRLDFKLQWIFLLFAFPLIVHMLVGNGMEYVDGFIINHFFDQATFAQFRYGARELPLVAVLVGSVSTALIPDAVNSMDDALKKVKTKITQLGNFLFPISISLMLLSSTIFPIIYSEDFAISAQIFNIYLLIITSRILMPQVVIFARHNNLILVISAIVELVVNVALSLVLLQYFGILGIAWATVIAFMVNKTILIVFAYTKHGIPLGKYLNIRHYFLWIFLLCISYLIAHYFL